MGHNTLNNRQVYTAYQQVIQTDAHTVDILLPLQWSDRDRLSVYLNSRIADHPKNSDRVKPDAQSLNANCSLIIKLASGNGRSDCSNSHQQAEHIKANDID